jgi:hypothetical protein
VIAGGAENRVNAGWAVVGGGRFNSVNASFGTIGGGEYNCVRLDGGVVAGGAKDTVAGFYGFVAGSHSVIPSASYINSAAFNGEAATASGQTRVGILSKAAGAFVIDHPLDPGGKILNHFFVEGPEMLNIYRGSVMLGADGRTEVILPDYFSALNRSPMVQLTGVGTSDVYLEEKVNGNRFAIGGTPGAEVYWQVTGERRDVSAEVTRRLMPVEQSKTGGLVGRMLDDDFLVSCMGQLVDEGNAAEIDFRTPAGRQRYEDMRRSAGR